MCTSSQRLASYGEIIGTAIGSFVVALIVGNIMGLLCGVKLSRNKSVKHSHYNVTPNKEVINEDIQLDLHVKMSENVCYEVVKKI